MEFGGLVQEWVDGLRCSREHVGIAASLGPASLLGSPAAG